MIRPCCQIHALGLMPEVQLDRRRCFDRGPLGSSFPAIRLAGDRPGTGANTGVVARVLPSRLLERLRTLAWTEQRCANSDHGGTFLNGDFKVVAHSH